MDQDVFMESLQVMQRNVSRVFYNKLKKFSAPLVDCFGISHFCYNRITNSGFYVYTGICPEWEEYCWSEKMYLNDPSLRHPDNFCSGVSHLRVIKDEKWNEYNLKACEKFQINCSLLLRNKTANGIESFGFALQSTDPLQHVTLLNELPLLKLFIRRFQEEFRSLNSVLEDNQVDLASIIGPTFNNIASPIMSKPIQREQFLKKMGIAVPSLTLRELEIVRELPKGYSASQIGNELFISTRTVEHHLDRIKDKFCCSSKSELIQKVRELESLGCLSL